VEFETDVSARLADDVDSHDTARSDQDIAALQAAILEKLTYLLAKRRAVATERDWLMATAYALRDRIVDRWLAGIDDAYEKGSKRVYYLSLEFLIGRLLFDNLNNLNTLNTVRAALAGLDVDLDRLRTQEPDAALGNGGLGRLAACYMESMATLNIPAHGYGIRYEHGLFRQVMKNGWQQEFPEDWLALGNPWEFHRPEMNYPIGFGGHIEAVPISEAAVRHVWHPAETIEAVAYDTPSVGWRGRRVNTLRLWSAQSADPLRLDRNCGCGRNISSFRPRCRTSSAGISRRSAISATWRTRPRSSSMTRIRRSESPN
jgi:starch phosphorylase